MTNVATYNRVSDKSESVKFGGPTAQPILENQQESTRRYAVERGWTIVEEYSEIATDRLGMESRKEMLRLLSDAKTGRFRLVIFTTPSRMSRGGILAVFDILKTLDLAGVGWRFVEMPALNYDQDTAKVVKDIMFSIFAAIDEDFRRRISESTRRKLASLKTAGRKLGAAAHKPGCGCVSHRHRVL